MIAGKLTPEEMRLLMGKLPIGPTVAKLNSLPDADAVARHELMDKQRLIGIRPTTDEAKLNKTEQSYLAWLRTQGDLWLGVMCLKLKIGHDCQYCPDFWALDATGLRAIDVKAKWGDKPHIEDDAKVKIAVCARMYPWVRFVIAWPDGGVWRHKDILP